jgi:DNA-binding NarL/FixJ family response regulator
LRDDPRTANTPVVVLSGDTWPDRRQRLLDRGASGYLTKPFDIDEVLQLIDSTAAAGHRGDAADRPEWRRAPTPSSPAAGVPSMSETELAHFIHDLNNQLGIILNYSIMLASTVDEPGATAQLAAIEAATERAIELARDVATGHPSQLGPSRPTPR